MASSKPVQCASLSLRSIEGPKWPTSNRRLTGRPMMKLDFLRGLIFVAALYFFLALATVIVTLL